MFTETSTPSPVPSICIPPWAGGLCPPSVVHAHEENVPRNAADAKAKCPFRASKSHRTSCSSVCGSRREKRYGTVCRMILGTSVTCSTSGNKLSRIFRTSTTEFTICGSEVWSKGTTRALSTICSKMRLRTRSSRLTSATWSGREPPSSGLLWGGFFRNSTMQCNSFPPPPSHRLLPSSGAVRGGADSQQGPLRRSSVHT